MSLKLRHVDVHFVQSTRVARRNHERPTTLHRTAQRVYLARSKCRLLVNVKPGSR